MRSHVTCLLNTLPQLFLLTLPFCQPRAQRWSGRSSMHFCDYLSLENFEHCRRCLVIYWTFQTIWTCSIWKPNRPGGRWYWIGRRLQVIMYQEIKGAEGAMTTMSSVKRYVASGKWRSQIINERTTVAQQSESVRFTKFYLLYRSLLLYLYQVFLDPSRLMLLGVHNLSR